MSGKKSNAKAQTTTSIQKAKSKASQYSKAYGSPERVGKSSNAKNQTLTSIQKAKTKTGVGGQIAALKNKGTKYLKGM